MGSKQKPTAAAASAEAGHDASSATYDEMIAALSRAFRVTLNRAVLALHASALERGQTLLPIEQLARRGLSSMD